MSKAIQIVVFDNPYPPKYGGVIDVFYKIKSLNENDVQIYLHYFDDDQEPLINSELTDYCVAIYRYQRQYSLSTYTSLKPFIVQSRRSTQLQNNLIKIGHPVFYEGLNSTFSLRTISKLKLKTAVRLHNIEHHYYRNLGKLENDPIKKLGYRIEALRLKWFEKNLDYADHLFPISKKDYNYFNKRYNKVTYLPVFQSKSEILVSNGGTYCLFHGDLRLSDNIRSALSLIDIFSNYNSYPLVIASSFQSEVVSRAVAKNEHISFKQIGSLKDLELLIQNAGSHILMSFQSSGIKLKLLNALFSNLHVIVNKQVVDGSGLEDYCHIFKDEATLLELIQRYNGEILSEQELGIRRIALEQFNTTKSVEKILEFL